MLPHTVTNRRQPARHNWLYPYVTTMRRNCLLGNSSLGIKESLPLYINFSARGVAALVLASHNPNFINVQEPVWTVIRNQSLDRGTFFMRLANSAQGMGIFGDLVGAVCTHQGLI